MEAKIALSPRQCVIVSHVQISLEVSAMAVSCKASGVIVSNGHISLEVSSKVVSFKDSGFIV